MNRKRSLLQKAVASPEQNQKLCFYLEDKTPIRTIEVSNVPTDSSKDFSEEFIRDYFERIGPVERVEIAKTTINESLAYVTFAQPEHVAALIQDKDVTGYTRCSKFIIKIADDAHQIGPNVLRLEDVNDHCLLYIMSYLTLFEAINLCNTSTRMQSVGQIYYGKFTKFCYRTPQQDSSINATNLPVVLEAIGDHISSIDWRYLTAAQFDLLAKYCPNVTELKLTSLQREVNKAINQSKGFFEKLKKLYIASSDYLFDVQIRKMMSGKKLKTLDIQNCNKICGKFFTNANCVKLKNLSIVNCTNVKKKNFNLHEWKGKLTTFASDACCNYLLFLALPTEKLEKIKELHLDISCFKGATRGLNFSGLKQLKILSLTRTHQFNSIDANNMIDKLSQIESLESLSIYRITIDTNTIQRLRSLKNLKYLKMNRIDNKIGTNLYGQIREYLSTLRELTIIDDVTVCTITGKEVNDIIAGMPMLNYFSHSSISWDCLDGIRQTKSITALDEKKPPLRIAVPISFFNNPKKEAFEAIHKGAIKLCVRQ